MKTEVTAPTSCPCISLNIDVWLEYTGNNIYLIKMLLLLSTIKLLTIFSIDRSMNFPILRRGSSLDRFNCQLNILMGRDLPAYKLNNE